MMKSVPLVLHGTNTYVLYEVPQASNWSFTHPAINLVLKEAHLMFMFPIHTLFSSCYLHCRVPRQWTSSGKQPWDSTRISHRHLAGCSDQWPILDNWHAVCRLQPVWEWEQLPAGGWWHWRTLLHSHRPPCSCAVCPESGGIPQVLPAGSGRIPTWWHPSLHHCYCRLVAITAWTANIASNQQAIYYVYFGRVSTAGSGCQGMGN